MKSQIGTATANKDGKVDYQVRAEAPDGSALGDTTGTMDLDAFMASGWDLDGKLEKPGDTASIVAEGEPISFGPTPQRVGGKLIADMTMDEKLKALRKGDEEIRRLNEGGAT